MASVAAGYLPILIFLGIALVLSSAFVFLPMAVNMNAASPPSRIAAPSSTCAST